MNKIAHGFRTISEVFYHFGSIFCTISEVFWCILGCFDTVFENWLKPSQNEPITQVLHTIYSIPVVLQSPYNVNY